MENIQFDFSDFHRYGRAFYEFLELRKKVFVDQLKWDVPHNDAVEMDQYDTPVAHYSLVLRDGVVIGGARTMATTAIWGEHTYMLRDAWSGKLPHIPRHVMSVEIASPAVWECTRLVISDQLTSQVERSECLTLIVDGLVDMARAKGASTLISLSPLPFMRAMRQTGVWRQPAGRGLSQRRGWAAIRRAEDAGRLFHRPQGRDGAILQRAPGAQAADAGRHGAAGAPRGGLVGRNGLTTATRTDACSAGPVRQDMLPDVRRTGREGS